MQGIDRQKSFCFPFKIPFVCRFLIHNYQQEAPTIKPTLCIHLETGYDKDFEFLRCRRIFLLKIGI